MGGSADGKGMVTNPLESNLPHPAEILCGNSRLRLSAERSSAVNAAPQRWLRHNSLLAPIDSSRHRKSSADKAGHVCAQVTEVN